MCVCVVFSFSAKNAHGKINSFVDNLLLCHPQKDQLNSNYTYFPQSKLGDTSTKWAPIAQAFSRTVKAVKRKYDKLQNPGKEQQRKSRTRIGSLSQGGTMDPSVGQLGQHHLQHGYMTHDASHLHGASSHQTDMNLGSGMDASGMYHLTAGLDPSTFYSNGVTTSEGMAMAMTSEDQALAAAAAAAAAAMQANGSSQGLTADQMNAYMAAYSGYYSTDPNSQGGNGAIQMDPSFLHQLNAVQQQLAHGYNHEMQAGAQNTNGGGMGVGGTIGGTGSTSQPKNDRVFWKPQEQQELMRLVQDPSYRQQVLGTADLSWDAIAQHLGRGKRSVQRKYDNLKGSLMVADGALALPANDGKKWSSEEVAELVRLVEDQGYREAKLGMEKVDWRVLGQHFGRSYESVSYKYSYVKNTGRTGIEGKSKHAKAKHETSYKEMAIWALQKIGGEGTSGQICNMISTNPSYAPQLDTAIVSGKKTLQRWKHGVRSALNAFTMFEKTNRVFEGEVVWRLLEEAVAQEMAAAQEKALRQRNKPLSGAARRKLKREISASHHGVYPVVGGGGGGMMEDGAQHAQQALAQLKGASSKKRKMMEGEEYAMSHQHHQHHHHHQMGADPSAIEAANAAGMDPSQLDLSSLAHGHHSHLMNPQALSHSHHISIQQIFGPNGTITPEQLALLPPDQLAMLQQQMDASIANGQLSVLPLVLANGNTTNEGDVAATGSANPQGQGQHDGVQGTGDHVGMDQAASLNPYDPTSTGHYSSDAAMQLHQAAMQHHAAYAAHQQQFVAEQYAAVSSMMDHTSSGVVQGVQLGQPAIAQGLDMSAYDYSAAQYGHFPQQYGSHTYPHYQYDPTGQYHLTDQHAGQGGYHNPGEEPYGTAQHMGSYSLPPTSTQ